MILLSAHKDTIMHPYAIAYKDGKYIGLLDNYIGMLVCNSLILEEPNLVKLEKKKEVEFFYGSGEEWALHEDFPNISKQHTIIVVDVASGDQYDGIDFSIENISGFNKKEVTDFREHLEWEGFKLKTKIFDGNPDDEDEAWSWKKLGYKVVSFIIPIENGNKNTGWHVDDCTITIEKLNKAKRGLLRLINIML